MLNKLFLSLAKYTTLALITLTSSLLQATELNEVAIYQPEKTFTAYLEKDVRVLEENPVILRPGQYLKSGDLYMVDAAATQGSKHVYLELIVDWIEPIELSAGINEIRVSSLVGDATATLPTSAATTDAPTPLQVDQILPVGTTVKVGPDGCVGLDIGSTHAVCLIPGTVATINRNNSGKVDDIIVKLDNGAVFSHVNLKNNPTDFKIETPIALAAARGTDFVTVALPGVTDVWIQEGSVELFQPNGTSVGTVSSDNGGSPKILRFPPAADELARIKANTLTFTAAATVIPQLNVKLPKLRAKQAKGEPLTPLEQTIVDNAQQMHALVKVVALGSTQ